jgi:DNA-binding NtrC family response regulator
MTGSGKILVVDDESNIRLLLSEVLSDKGFEVTEAKDGQESLEKMEKHDFDLVITDVNMPRLDGIAMLHRMEKAGRKEKVIVMTANPSNQMFLHSSMNRVVTQLYKPFSITDFLSVVISATAGGEHVTGIDAPLQC